MINRLKQACGYEFTNKFHRMFTDISLAEDLNTKFTAFLEREKSQVQCYTYPKSWWLTGGTFKKNLKMCETHGFREKKKMFSFLFLPPPQVGLNYFVRVLQQGAWPLSQTGLSPLNVPLELERTVQAYETFYAKQFSGRKLTWLHHLSNGDVRVGCLSKPYIINMTTFQMAILLLFEKTDSLSCRELRETTNIQEEQFPRYLQSLLEAKLLTCSSEVREEASLKLCIVFPSCLIEIHEIF